MKRPLLTESKCFDWSSTICLTKDKIHEQFTRTDMSMCNIFIYSYQNMLAKSFVFSNKHVKGMIKNEKRASQFRCGSLVFEKGMLKAICVMGRLCLRFKQLLHETGVMLPWDGSEAE